MDRIVDFSNPVEKAKELSHFRSLEGKHRVSDVKYRKRRSDSQNAYMWAVVVPYVAAGLQEAWGENLSPDDVHEFLKSAFLPKREIVNHVSGEVAFSFTNSTTRLTTAEFTEYLERIAQFAAEKLSVVIPLPNETIAA